MITLNILYYVLIVSNENISYINKIILLLSVYRVAWPKVLDDLKSWLKGHEIALMVIHIHNNKTRHIIIKPK